MIARLIVAAGLVLFVTGAAHATTPPPYYLALGDSLAVGIQPNAVGDLVPTTRGFVDHLYALSKLRQPNLRLKKLGCSGETTTTMIDGGVCPYTLGSQLADALAFIQTNRVAFITLSIGGANVLGCFSLGGVDPLCVENGLDVVGLELGTILAALRAEAGPGVRIVGMNYYDPFLAAWILGAQGKVLAAASLQATNGLNDVLGTLDLRLPDPGCGCRRSVSDQRQQAGAWIQSAGERLAGAQVDLDRRVTAGRTRHPSECNRIQRDRAGVPESVRRLTGVVWARSLSCCGRGGCASLTARVPRPASSGRSDRLCRRR